MGIGTIIKRATFLIHLINEHDLSIYKLTGVSNTSLQWPPAGQNQAPISVGAWATHLIVYMTIYRWVFHVVMDSYVPIYAEPSYVVCMSSDTSVCKHHRELLVVVVIRCYNLEDPPDNKPTFLATESYLWARLYDHFNR